MPKRKVALTLLCEDLQHEVFARRYFIRRGILPIYSEKSPKGRGAAEQWIRSMYVEQVMRLRRQANRRPFLALAIVLDADRYSVQERLEHLDRELINAGQLRRQPGERIAIFVPKRNIETWIHYLRGSSVDEEQAYRKLSGDERSCQDAVNKLADEICLGMPADAPQSLHLACDELIRIL